MATKKVAKVVEVAQVVAPVEVLEEVSTNVSMVDAAGNELTGIHLIRARAAKAAAAKNVKPGEAEELISGLLGSMNVPDDEIQVPFPVAETTVAPVETETAMNTSTLNPALVEATVEESMAELDGLVQQYNGAQQLMNSIREKLKPIAREYNEEMKEVKARKMASFSEGEKTAIYNAVLESCGLEVLANVYVGLLELDEYGIDDGEVSTPYPESFAQWCKSEGLTTEVSLFSEVVKAQKYDYLREKCQKNQKALGSVQAVVMGLFRAGKSSAKSATVSSGDVSENFAETTIKIPGYESAEKGLKVTKRLATDKFTPKGASTFNYLTKTLNLVKDSADYKEAEEALETVLKGLNA